MQTTLLTLLTTFLATASAAPTTQARQTTTIWSVQDLTIYSSQSTGQASISFLTNAAGTGTTPEPYECAATAPALEDGSTPDFVALPCAAGSGTGSTTFSFYPADDDDSSAVHSLIIYTGGDGDGGSVRKTGVAIFVRDSLQIKNGTERYVGSPNLGITNIF
ncbi:hypothetical protein F4778DRAFT_169212 [Xylariomycetidae sp. FL2044]|nr:hypothetical protein F4778DRAFT_169212 [Xylariomycetidae sp. FL2044]